MEERARLKALEALFDPTTTARIVALPAAGEVVIAVEASPGQRSERRRRAGSQQNESRGADTRHQLNLPETVTDTDMFNLIGVSSGRSVAQIAWNNIDKKGS